MTRRVEVVVIGGGQAGLATSHYLTQQGRDHVVLEQATKVGSAWRDRRWDFFTLVTPNWTVRLPGFPYRGDDPDGFMTRAEVVDHLEQYASSFGGHTMNLHHLAHNGVVLLGRLIGVRDNSIMLAADLQENLAFADKASDDIKNDVNAFVRRTGLCAPDPEPDLIDEARSDAGAHAPTTLDLEAAGVTSVIWANGYGFDYSWVHLPVLDDWGFPMQQRGVTKFPGLYFLGMNLLHSRKSGILLGVGDDAAHVAADIAGTA